MKTKLVANVGLNGQLILATTPDVPQAPATIANMGFIKAAECGNLIDELFVNIFPDMIAGGVLQPTQTLGFKVQSVETIKGIVCLHYTAA